MRASGTKVLRAQKNAFIANKIMTLIYKITFNLQTPISFLERSTFDGLLSFCYAKELLQDKFSQKLSYDKKEQIDFSGMPLNIH